MFMSNFTQADGGVKHRRAITNEWCCSLLHKTGYIKGIKAIALCMLFVFSFGITLAQQNKSLQEAKNVVTVLAQQMSRTNAPTNGCISDAPEGPSVDLVAAGIQVFHDEGVITAIKSIEVSGTDCEWVVTYTYDIYCNGMYLFSIPQVYVGGDDIPPTLTTQSEGGELGCNPETIPTPEFDADDNCGDIDPMVTAGDIVEDGCFRSQTFTATATDACGNQAEPIEITYTWTSDLEAPVIETDSEDADLGCNPETLPVPSFSATDNCGDVVVMVVPGEIIADGCFRSQTYTANVSDACGNQAEPESVTYTWTVDTINPYIQTQQGDEDLGCNPQDIPIPFFVASDNCGEAELMVSYGDIMEDGCSRSQTFTASATDACGNQAEPIDITYTWIVDLEAPVIESEFETSDLGCNPEVIPTPDFMGSDNCGEVSVDIEAGEVQGEDCERSQTFTATATDACGNEAEPATVTYTWTVDTENPVITVASSGDGDGDGDTGGDQDGDEDECYGSSVMSYNPGPLKNGGPIVDPARIDPLKALGAPQNDDTNNFVSLGYGGEIIIGFDGLVYNLPGDDLMVLETTFNSNTFDSYPESADVFVSQDGVTYYLIGTDVTNQFASLDIANASIPLAYISFVKVVDTTPADSQSTDAFDLDGIIAITGCAPNSGGDPNDLGCNPSLDDLTPNFMVSDNCSEGEATVTTDGPVADEEGCGFSQTFTANYTDDCGNAAEPVSVTYIWTVDLEVPVITTEAFDTDLGCNPSEEEFVIPEFEVTDNCSAGDAIVTQDEDVVDGCSMFRTYTANFTDACGNVAQSISVTYTWTSDTEIPVIDPLEDDDLGCNPEEIMEPLFTASDNCEVGTPAVTAGDIIADGCNRSQTFTANVMDACGNDAEPVTVTYTWIVDTEAPIITTSSGTDGDGDDNGDGNETIDECYGSTVIAYNPGVTKSGNPIAPNRLNPNQGLGAPQNDDTLNFVSLGYGGEIIIGFNGAVYNNPGDDIAILETSFGDVSFDAYPESADVYVSMDGVTFYLIGTDITNAFGDFDISNAPVYLPFITQVKLVDTTPADSVSEDGYDLDGIIALTGCSLIPDENENDLGCNPETIPVPEFTATDNCSEVEVSVSTEGPVATANCGYEQTFTATATDDCGNVAEPVSVTYTWTVDLEAPTITSDAEDMDLGCNPSEEDFMTPTFDVADNCSADLNAEVTIGEIVVDGCSRSLTYTANATDNCGNDAEPVTVTFTWTMDTDDPIIDVEAEPMMVECDGEGNTDELEDYLTNFGGAMASDLCGDVTWTSEVGEPTIDGCITSIMVTFTATDHCSNYTSTTGIFTIEDSVGPEFDETLEDYSVQCLDDVPEADLLTATDSCSGAAEVSYSTSETGDAADLDPCETTIVRTWTATDACGNETVYTQTITVADTTAPIIACPSSSVDDRIVIDPSIDCTDSFAIVDFLNVQLEDNCSPTVAATPSSIIRYSDLYNTLPDGSIEVFGVLTYAAGHNEDQCGNFAEDDCVVYFYYIETPETSGGLRSADICKTTEFFDGRSRLTERCGSPEVVAVAFTAYPVPFNNEINIGYSFDYDTKIAIKVYDTKGVVVSEMTLDNYIAGTKGETTIDLSRVATQMLYVKLETDRGEQIKKIISSGKK